jgi:hypothetical protein
MTDSTITDMSSSPRAVRSFRKAKIHSRYQSVQPGPRHSAAELCLCTATAVITALYRVRLLRHAVDGMLHASSPPADVPSEQGQSQAGCAGGPAEGAARSSYQGPEADPSRRAPAGLGGCLRWGECPGMLQAHCLACINTHTTLPVNVNTVCVFIM